MKRAVFFDLDNTLYDYNFPHKKATKSLEKEGISYSDYLDAREEIHKDLSGLASSHSRILYFQRLLENKGIFDFSKVLRLHDLYWQTFFSHMKKSSVPIKILQELRNKDMKIVVVSDFTTEIQLRKIKKLGLTNYVDYIVTSEEVGSEKPHSIMFLTALKKVNLSPDKVVMVGDNANADIKGANFVGIDTIMLGSEKTDKYSNPDYTIKHISEIFTAIDKLNLKHVQEEGYIKYVCHFKKSKPYPLGELNKYRQKLYDKGLIGAYKNKIGFGNISVRKKTGFLISGSTTGNYKKLTPKHYSYVYFVDSAKNELFCKGPIKASSESMTHAALYDADPKIGAVIHVHSLPLWKKYLDKLPTTPEYARYGTPELASEIKKLYPKCKDNVAVLGGHKEGLISFGKNLKEAYDALMVYASNS